MMSEREKLALFPAEELRRPADKWMSWQDLLVVLSYGKLLLNRESEQRLYTDFGLQRPENPYPVLTWNSLQEAAAQEIFTDKPTGEAVECQHVGRQLCYMLELGNPGAQYTGRNFRGRAYAEALRGWILDYWEMLDSHAFAVKRQLCTSALGVVAGDLYCFLRDQHTGTVVDLEVLKTCPADPVMQTWNPETLDPAEMSMSIEQLVAQGFLEPRGEGQWYVPLEVHDYLLTYKGAHYHVYATNEENARVLLRAGVRSGDLRPSHPRERTGEVQV